jgi:hypothetical protein
LPLLPAELAEKVQISSMGTGTPTRPAPYIITQHNILLLDSVGNAAREDWICGESIAADILLVFLGLRCRGEQMHGLAAALAFRLRSKMKTIFVVPQADMLIRETLGER